MFLDTIITVSNSRYKVVVVGNDRYRLDDLEKKYDIDICEDMNDLSNVSMIVACTHNQELLLKGECLKQIRPDNKKIVVVDVAEPSNLKKDEYKKYKHYIIRQDAGNAYSKNLKYVLSFLSYKRFRLNEDVTFGCFAEALSIGLSLKENKVNNRNYFEISNENILHVKELFKSASITTTLAKNFGKKVSFNR